MLRAGLLAEQIDHMLRSPPAGEAADDPHRLFIADEEGRLVSRLGLGERLLEQKNDSLRVDAARADRPVAHVLGRAMALDPTGAGAERFEIDGEAFLVTLRSLDFTQGWRLCILVPEAHYLGPLEAFWRRLLVTGLLSLLALASGGALVLRGLRRGLGAIESSTARMSRFDFSPVEAPATFRDVERVMDGLEQAKTALRAMGRYVPVDLVRQLYRERREPRLGGEPATLSLMFTDIRDFTTLSERIPVDALAGLLGRYFETMAGAIHSCDGIIDKYIGDAVMALWNAPRPVARHPARCCEAALRCLAALEALFAAPGWEGHPRLETRFGLHTGEVLVGHFGAPDRLSYTVLGDGVNLAARLEGLNKVYGTSILASQPVAEAAGGEFLFRRVDVVTVKGRERPEAVYQLIGRRDELTEVARYARYEEALAAYQRRAFEQALVVLQELPADGPARVLSARCRDYLAEPPPLGWRGVYTVGVK